MTVANGSYFSDLLCVWAYVSQRRIDELTSTFSEQIALDLHFFSVFGSVQRKLQRGWSDRGGAGGYSDHVKEVVSLFEDIEVHPDVWKVNTPESSVPCHIFLSATRLLAQGDHREGNRLVGDAARELRLAFFRDCRDISARDVQLAVAEDLGYPRTEIEGHLHSGRAHTVFHDDQELAHEHAIRVSPTLLFDSGRQRLTGNVGYRVIEANVRELLQRPEPGEQASWC
jgi:predicted DsbA family dithiol-disulfide isomerase